MNWLLLGFVTTGITIGIVITYVKSFQKKKKKQQCSHSFDDNTSNDKLNVTGGLDNLLPLSSMRHAYKMNNVEIFAVTHNHITFTDISTIIKENLKLSIDNQLIKNLESSRKIFEEKINNSEDKYYGINTGFGGLHNIKVDDDKLCYLQENLLKSHACGVGDKVESRIVKLMILLKIISLSKGYSGINVKTIERLLFFYNKNILPVVYRYGSLGASGDLVPLSHMSLPLIGLGEVEFKNKIYNTETILRKFDISPLKLGAKEGLALINGTQYMLASLIDSTMDSVTICNHADLIASASCDAFKCNLSSFDPLISSLRPYEGQVQVSNNILNNLEGGMISSLKKKCSRPILF